MSYPELAAKFAKHLLPIFLLVASGCAHRQERMPPPSAERPLSYRIERFERPERASWQKPDEVVQALALKDGDVVADIGAGSGYFSRRFAKAVAPSGKVYSVDVAADILGYLRERADQEGLRNIVTVVSRDDDPMLPSWIARHIPAPHLGEVQAELHQLGERRRLVLSEIVGLAEGRVVAQKRHDAARHVVGVDVAHGRLAAVGQHHGLAARQPRQVFLDATMKVVLPIDHGDAQARRRIPLLR